MPDSLQTVLWRALSGGPYDNGEAISPDYVRQVAEALTPWAWETVDISWDDPSQEMSQSGGVIWPSLAGETTGQCARDIEALGYVPPPAGEAAESLWRQLLSAERSRRRMRSA